jgi:hypothetical protein
MLAEILGTGLALVLIGCGAPPALPKHPDPKCSDEVYAAITAECSAKAARCVVEGGTEEACGAVCDTAANDWQERCQ